MSDDKNKRGVPDSKLISLTQPYEVDYWCERFDIGFDTLQYAVEECGSHSTEKVKQWLIDNGYISQSDEEE